MVHCKAEGWDGFSGANKPPTAERLPAYNTGSYHTTHQVGGQNTTCEPATSRALVSPLITNASSRVMIINTQLCLGLISCLFLSDMRRCRATTRLHQQVHQHSFICWRVTVRSQTHHEVGLGWDSRSGSVDCRLRSVGLGPSYSQGDASMP